MKTSDIKSAWDLPPKEAINYLQNKSQKITFDYKELSHEAHHRAFTAAKAMRSDVLNDLHEALITAQKEGKSFERFKKELKPTLQKKGWYGKTEQINPQTGEVKTVKVGSRRLRTIFETNMRVANNVGRYKAQKQLPNSEYWMYTSLLFGPHRRPDHKRMHKTLLHRDNPWWATNYPPNGWGCACKVRAYSKAAAKARGLSISDKAPENIASKDWAYDIGAGSRVGKLESFDLDSSLASLPAFMKNNAYDKLSESKLKEEFYKKTKTKPGEVFVDKTGDPLVIDDGLFTDKKTGDLKIKRVYRHLYLDHFPKLLNDPDEIYLSWSKKGGYKKNMFKYFNEDGEKRALMAVFRYFKDKTQGVTLFYVKHDLEKRRGQKLIYQKEAR